MTSNLFRLSHTSQEPGFKQVLGVVENHNVEPNVLSMMLKHTVTFIIRVFKQRLMCKTTEAFSAFVQPQWLFCGSNYCTVIRLQEPASDWLVTTKQFVFQLLVC